MREILFRGKRVDNGEWIEGYLYRLSETLNPFIMLKGRCGEAYEVIPETVGQFTGLTDKNGKKIFEGDIVCAITFYTRNKQKALVFFDSFIDENNGDEYIGFYIRFRGINTTIAQLEMEQVKDRFEVIGNIHDNPKLLNEVEE